MRYGSRTFVVVKGKIKRIGLDRFARICSKRMPECAGQKIPYTVLVFESEQDGSGDASIIGVCPEDDIFNRSLRQLT